LDSQFLSEKGRQIESELMQYAARTAPRPSTAFVDRVVAAATLGSLPNAAQAPRAESKGLLHAAGRRLRLSLAQVAGGPTIPLRVRLQAGAMLVVAALLITAGAALAAAGATSVVTYIEGPRASTTGHEPSASPILSLSPSPSTSPSPSPSPSPSSGSSPTPAGSSGAEGSGATGSDSPGNGGKPSQNPGNCGLNGQSGQNHGNCGQPSGNPGNKPSDNPGNGVGPAKSPKATSKAKP
jgi:hypothetical protein